MVIIGEKSKCYWRLVILILQFSYVFILNYTLGYSTSKVLIQLRSLIFLKEFWGYP